MDITWVWRKTDIQESCSDEHTGTNSIFGSKKEKHQQVNLSFDMLAKQHKPQKDWRDTSPRDDFGFPGNVVSWKISNCVHAVFYKSCTFAVAFWEYWRVVILGFPVSVRWNLPAIHRHQQNSAPRSPPVPNEALRNNRGLSINFHFSQV